MPDRTPLPIVGGGHPKESTQDRPNSSPAAGTKRAPDTEPFRTRETQRAGEQEWRNDTPLRARPHGKAFAIGTRKKPRKLLRDRKPRDTTDSRLAQREGST